jgi:hypothetical protein
MLALAYVIIFETEKASIVIEAMESLGTIWAVGLSVLGIYVYKRSEDKKLWTTPKTETPSYVNKVDSSMEKRLDRDIQKYND